MDWLQVLAVCACACASLTLTVATPPRGHVKQPDTDQNPPKYEFGYDVRDGEGGSQGHLETRQGEYALGKYYVSLPRNQQRVDYFADDWGYHPLVEYRTASMTSQFALGDKAVAALAKQYGVAPPLEILKTKVAQSLVAGGGPQVSVQGTSGLIPGPSDEPVHNSIEGEAYTPSSTPSYNTAEVRGTSESAGIEVSTISPSTHIPLGRGAVTTENYPNLSNLGSVQYATSIEQQNSYGSSEHAESSGYSSTESPVSNLGSVQYATSIEQQNSYGSSEHAESSGYSSTESPVSFIRPDSSSHAGTSSPQSIHQHDSYTSNGHSLGLSSSTSNNAEIKESHYYEASPLHSSSHAAHFEGQQYSTTNEQSDQHDVTSYVADSNSALDVTNNALSRRYPGVDEAPGSPNTYISTFLVGDKGSQYEENEIRHGFAGYGSSTTQRPPKTILKPIVVSELSGTGSPLALYSVHGSSPTAHRKVKGKLYHREGRLKSVEDVHPSGPGGYSSSTTTANSLLKNEEHEYYSTVAPTFEPVLVTPRVPSRLTSSGNVLAPIQAGVSISTHEHKNENINDGYTKDETLQEEPDIEKQVIREEAVYKTTVDIQKSIPFEIHPDDDSSKHENDHGSQEEYQVPESVSETPNSGYNVAESDEYVHQDNREYSNSVEGDKVNPQPQVDAYTTHQPLGHPEPSSGPQYQYSAAGNNQHNFLQNVVYAYHRLANNHDKQYVPGYPVNVPVINQPLFVPNRLYYVYMQRYNPFHSRYGSQQQLYTNYRPPVTSAPVQPSPTPAYISNNDHSQPSQQLFTPGYTASVEENSGYSSEGENQSGEYESNNQANLVNIEYGNPEKGFYHGSSDSAQSTNTQNVNDESNFNHQIRDNGLSTPSPYSDGDKYEQSQQAAQEYAAQLNALGSAVRAASGALKTGVHPENQHVQYSTGPGEDKRTNSQEDYSPDGQPDSGKEKYVQEASSTVHNSANVLIKEVPVPQYIERTKLVEVEKPVPVPHPVPVEYTRVVEKPVPIVHPVPVHHTQIVEKPVAVPHPVPVEVTRILDRPVPVPYSVTKLVAVDRPVAFPHPVPLPYPVPVPHLVPYPVKDYRPVYIYRKATGGRLLHREAHVKQFRPSQPVFTSQYPPQTYEVTGYFKPPHGKSRGYGRKLCIEYGGFKPPLVPSVQLEDDHNPDPQHKS